eukprot:365183-Chlamydomonas_euryale.AAC.8
MLQMHGRFRRVLGVWKRSLRRGAGSFRPPAHTVFRRGGNKCGVCNTVGPLVGRAYALDPSPDAHLAPDLTRVARLILRDFWRMHLRGCAGLRGTVLGSMSKVSSSCTANALLPPKSCRSEATAVTEGNVVAATNMNAPATSMGRLKSGTTAPHWTPLFYRSCDLHLQQLRTSPPVVAGL